MVKCDTILCTAQQLTTQNIDKIWTKYMPHLSHMDKKYFTWPDLNMAMNKIDI